MEFSVGLIVFSKDQDEGHVNIVCLWYLQLRFRLRWSWGCLVHMLLSKGTLR